MIALHEVLKTLHIFGVVLWIGSMFSVALLIPRMPGGKVVGDMRKLLVPTMTIAMIATLALGLIMAVQAGWMSQRWVHGKLTLAFVLAGLHGLLSGQMRRLSATNEPWPRPWLSYMPVLLGMLALAAIALAVSKPS